jgi:hypothetical protein
MTDFIRAPMPERFTMPPMPQALPKTQVTQRTTYNPLLDEAVERYPFDLKGFVLNTFHWGMPGTVLEHCNGPLDWQLQELETISELFRRDPRMVRVACSAGRGAGKTTLAAWAFLWAVSTHPDGVTTLMSVTGTQAESRVWREIRKWRHVWQFERDFEIKARSLSHKDKDTWFGLIQLWNMDRIGAIRGTHEQFLSFVIDECADIPDEVFREIEGGLTGPCNFLAYFSNPTRTIGRFANCFTEHAERWHCVQVDTRNVSIVTPESIQEILDDCLGDEDADRFRVEVRGEFPRSETDGVVSLLFLERACARYDAERDLPATQPANTPLTIGVDVASMGANKTVFLVRQGNYIREVMVFARLEQEDVADKLMELMEKYYQYYLGTYGVLDTVKEKHRLLKRAGYDMQVYIDSDGIGRATYEMCKRRGYPVCEVHSGGEAYEDYRYANKRSELWLRDMRQWVRDEARLDRTAPYYKTLTSELMNVYYRPVPPNRSQVETKREMLARGVQSPDHADALVYSFYGVNRPHVGAIPLRY